MTLIISIKLDKMKKADLGDTLCDLADRIENGKAKLSALKGRVVDADGRAVGAYEVTT